MKNELPGALIRSPHSEFTDKVFYVDQGKRHWIRTGEWLERNGFTWPNDVVDVEPRVLYAFLNGGPAPFRDHTDIGQPDLSSLDLRDIAASRLQGSGIEFGAGASPFPVPLTCNVKFADPFPYAALKAAMYPGQHPHELVRPDYVTDIKTLAGIPDASVDFIIGCHVIEHTNNPLRAIRECYRALRVGGSLVLVVPDMTKTFDNMREQTTLAHLIEDYERPSSERDRTHYIEFYSTAFTVPAEFTPDQYAGMKLAESGDIHYHCWTYESFNDVVDWSVRRDGWTISWSHSTLAGPENIEFYYVLTK